MERFNFDLKQSQPMAEVSFYEASQKYVNGVTVYVESYGNQWFSYNCKIDESLKYDPRYKYYVMEKVDEDVVIVTRHESVENFWRSRGVNARCVPVIRADECIGKTLYVAGSFPIHLAARAKEVYTLNVYRSSLEFDKLTPEQIKQIGYKIERFEVRNTVIERKETETLFESGSYERSNGYENYGF